VPSVDRRHAAVLMGAALRMMGTDRQHTKASVCLEASARCCVTGLPLLQAPSAAQRALPAVPGPSRPQVRAQWARAPWDRCTAGEASVWDDSGRDQVPYPYEPYSHACRPVSTRLWVLCVCGWCAVTWMTSGGGRQARRRVYSAARGRTQAQQVCQDPCCISTDSATEPCRRVHSLFWCLSASLSS
jgi:hypothetical protein